MCEIMKRTTKTIALLLAIIMLLGILAFTITADEAVEQVVLSEESLKFSVGEAVILTATVLPENTTNKTVYFSSTSPALVI